MSHTMSVLENLRRRDQYLEKLEKKVRAVIESSPQGRLRVSLSRGRTQYYLKEGSSDRLGVYIPKDKMEFVRGLAQREYEEKLLKTIMKERKAISAFLRLYPENPSEEVYSSFAETKKEIVIPELESDELFIRRWESIEYKGKELPEDDSALVTYKGERVRSKSEIIIANALEKEGIPYKYELPLRLHKTGITVYPDFTALRLDPREIVYWEHFGMMGNPEYADKAVRKIDSYIKEGIFPGDRLIITMETESTKISSLQLKRIINHYFK